MNQKYSDIIPPEKSPEKRSIRNIPLPVRKQQGEVRDHIEIIDELDQHDSEKPHKKVKAASHPHVEHHPHAHKPHEEASVHTRASKKEEYEQHIEPAFYEARRNDFIEVGKAKPRYVFWSVCGLVVVLALFIISSLFTHATITIASSSQEIPLNNASFSLATTSSSSGIIYDVISLSSETSLTVTSAEAATLSSGTSTSSNKTPVATAQGVRATGKVIIYNNYSKNPQELIETTRLETPDGLIYHITADVVVPGQQTVDGKLVPGSVAVNIVADQPEPKYNSDPKDFVIYGFKGTAKGKGFYARSTGPITGGSTTGSAPTAAGTDASLQSRLQTDLKNQITAQITAQLPENFVYIPSGMIVTYAAPVIAQTGTTGTVKVTQKASSIALIIDKQSLIKKLITSSAEQTSTSTLSDSQRFDADFSKVILSLPASVTSTVIKSGNITAVLDGVVIVKTSFDTAKTAKAVSNLSREQALAVIKSMKGVESVDISVSPWWKKSLPGADEITVESGEVQ